MVSKITVLYGNIAYVNADMHVNSSNGFLLHGSGTAEQYADYSGSVVGDELQEFWNLVNIAKEPLKSPLDHMYRIRKREPTRFQYESLEDMVVSRDSRPLKRGDAVIPITINNLQISNAVGMTYDWKKSPPKLIPATKKTVQDSLEKSFGFAKKLGCKSVAIPVMCTRKGGLSKEESSEATLSAIESSGNSIDKIFIVLYNDELLKNKQFFDEFYKDAL
ncbi:MAG: hypothetical protein ABIF85_02005 [Nanoarchaeota archaeon]